LRENERVGRGAGGEKERERISSRLHAEHRANLGLNLTTLRSGPDLKPRVGCLTD